MVRITHWGVRSGTIALAFLAFAIAAWVLLAGEARPSEINGASNAALRRPTGYAQLVSIEPMSMMEGATCLWNPVSVSTSLRVALLQEREEASSAATPADQRPVDVDRSPVRVIHDSNPLFSAIAVAPESNMLVVTDENLFQILEYDRRDNTPPSAKMTEPKRVIGGNLTKAEMMCGVYIDPKTLDTYIINNDTQDWMAVFSKDARGNVAPDRLLATPHGTFGITVDEERQELFLTVEHNNAVVVYRKMAEGEEPPLRYLAGNDSQLEDPHGVAVDTKRNLLIVSNHGSVSYREEGTAPAVFPIRRFGPTVDSLPRSGWRDIQGSGKFEPPSITIHHRDASGNTPPLRIIEGPKTGLNWPMQIAVDEERGELYVANDMDNAILVFRVTDHGDVSPTRSIKGPRTGIRHPTGVALDLKNREVWASSMGNHSASVFPMTANGNVPPLRTIRGGPANEPALMIGNPGAVGYDTKRDEILVPN